MSGETPEGKALAVKLARKQRHSFMNHLQVISGWLQLGRADRAQAYLESTAARMAAVGEVLRDLPPEAGFYVLQIALEAETYAVQILWRAEPGSADAASEVLAATRAAVSEAMARAEGQSEDERRLVVCIGSGGFTVHTPAQEGER